MKTTYPIWVVATRPYPEKIVDNGIFMDSSEAIELANKLNKDYKKDIYKVFEAGLLLGSISDNASIKATIEFDLETCDDEQFKIYSRAMDWALAMWDLDQELRKYLKYGHKFETADEAFDEARKLIRECLEDWGISLEDIR